LLALVGLRAAATGLEEQASFSGGGGRELDGAGRRTRCRYYRLCRAFTRISHHRSNEAGLVAVKGL